MQKAFVGVFEHFIAKLSGSSWAKTAEMMERFGLKAG